MKRIMFLFLLIGAFISAQSIDQTYTVVGLEGKVSVYHDAKQLKVKKGIALNATDIADAQNGAIVLSVGKSDAFVVLQGFTSRVQYAPSRIFTPEDILALKKGKAKISEVLERSKILSPEIKSLGKPVNPNINFVLVLDVSTSMRNVNGEIQDYLCSKLVNEIMKDGDYLYLVTFGENVNIKYSGKVRFPADGEKIRALINSIQARENATDIGLAMEQLDVLIKTKLPNEKTSIFFITDGKNNPMGTSPYYKKNVFDPKSFDIYTVAKESSMYKVLLLSIGDDTAARNLREPLGGEYVEVDRSMTSDTLNNLLKDFVNMVELILPENLGRIGSLKLNLPMQFLSTYQEEKKITVSSIRVTIDDGAPYELTDSVIDLTIRPQSQVLQHIKIALPKTLKKGAHTMQLEFIAGDTPIAKSMQTLSLIYSPLTLTIFIIVLASLLVLAVLVIAFIRIRREKEQADENKKENAEKDTSE